MVALNKNTRCFTLIRPAATFSEKERGAHAPSRAALGAPPKARVASSRWMIPAGRWNPHARRVCSPPPPLPAGEGRGEGDRVIKTTPCRKFFKRWTKKVVSSRFMSCRTSCHRKQSGRRWATPPRRGRGRNNRSSGKGAFHQRRFGGRW